MKSKTLLLLLLACGLSLGGCKIERGLAGSGVRKTEKRDLKSFSAIDTTGAYTIDVTCQKAAGVEVEADDNILPLIKTEVRDGILFVTNDQPYHSAKTVTLRITLPELNSVTNHGAGQIKITDANSSDLKIDSTGAASVDASGTAKSVQILSTGAGQIDTSKLHADKAKVDVSGAASVDVYASEQLDVNVSGASNVSYSGNPKTVNKHVSGIGSVNPSGR
jgi:Putative auto-transporter adhesin, head GIN domain